MTSNALSLIDNRQWIIMKEFPMHESANDSTWAMVGHFRLLFFHRLMFSIETQCNQVSHDDRYDMKDMNNEQRVHSSDERSEQFYWSIQLAVDKHRHLYQLTKYLIRSNQTLFSAFFQLKPIQYGYWPLLHSWISSMPCRSDDSQSCWRRLESETA